MILKNNTETELNKNWEHWYWGDNRKGTGSYWSGQAIISIHKINVWNSDVDYHVAGQSIEFK